MYSMYNIDSTICPEYGFCGEMIPNPTNRMIPRLRSHPRPSTGAWSEQRTNAARCPDETGTTRLSRHGITGACDLPT